MGVLLGGGSLLPLVRPPHLGSRCYSVQHVRGIRERVIIIRPAILLSTSTGRGGSTGSPTSLLSVWVGDPGALLVRYAGLRRSIAIAVPRGPRFFGRVEIVGIGSIAIERSISTKLFPFVELCE